MKKLLLVLLLLPFITYSQTGYENSRNNGVNQTTERYVINSPGNTPTTSFTTWRVKDSTYIEWNFPYLYLRKIPDSINIGSPKNFLHTGPDGRLLSSSISWLYPDTLFTFPTKNYLNLNYYNKAQSDTRYLMGYTELDPLSLHISDTGNKWLNINTHIPLDPVNSNWNSNTGLSQILNKPTLVTSYHQLTDTLNITPTNINNWNTSYSWGNWALQGFIKGTDTISLSNRINGKLSISDTLNKFYPRNSNPTGYLIGVDTINISTRINNKLNSIDTLSLSNRINLKLSYTDTLNLSNRLNLKLSSLDTLSLSNRINLRYLFPTGGTSLQYLNGLGNLVTFPTIPSQLNLIGSINTKITGTYPNITIADSNTVRTYTSSGFINQPIKIFTDTLSPSTSNGYSINISSAGFTRILSANVIAIRNTTSASTSPNISIKTMSTTAITCNIFEDNPATVSILGIGVLSGLPSIFANVTGLQIAVTIIGY